MRSLIMVAICQDQSKEGLGTGKGGMKKCQSPLSRKGEL